MLQCKGCCLFLRLFVRVITVDTEALVGFGVIDGSAVVCKTIFFHRTGNIALCRSLRFFQRLIVQLIVKAVFNMVIGCNLIGRGHLRGIAVNGFCGQPFRFSGRASYSSRIFLICAWTLPAHKRFSLRPPAPRK